MLNLLMVDDEVRTLKAVESNVDWAKCGINNVFMAENLETALEIMNDKRVDILLCDIEMPGGSGLELLARVREAERDLPCIFLTCHAEFSYMRQAIQLNSADYILKPVRYEELEETVTKTVKAIMEKGEIAGTVNTVAIEQQVLSRSRNIENEVKAYIRDHMVEVITVNDMAKQLHFNPQYLSRLLKQNTGISISEYITKERIRAAKKFLADSSLSIKLIAELVGYPDNAYFARVFKLETGHSPSSYRKNKKIR